MPCLFKGSIAGSVAKRDVCRRRRRPPPQELNPGQPARSRLCRLYKPYRAVSLCARVIGSEL